MKSNEDGLILILETDVDSEKFVLVNIYTPNNIQAQQNFFLKLAEMLRSLANAMIIKIVIAKINHMMGTFDLVDVWRNLHPKDKQWTWSSPDTKITCWLHTTS